MRAFRHRGGRIPNEGVQHQDWRAETQKGDEVALCAQGVKFNL